MAGPLFTPSYIKLARAKQFIAELVTELSAYKNRKPYKISMRQAELHIEWDGIGELSNAIVGDTIHNLRAALDLMACELARINGKSDKDVYFPFADSAETFDSAIKRKNFDRCGADSIELLKQFEPYAGGKIMLRELHDMDIQDKHISLIAMDSTHDMQIRGLYDITNPDKTASFEIIGEMRFVFPVNSVLAKRQVVKTLEEFVEVVNGILEAFASMVAARPVTGH